MDDAKIPLQKSVPHKVSLFLAVAVTLDVLLTIRSHWHDFGILSRFVAVVLLANLVVMPVHFVRGQRGDKPLGRDQLLVFAYMSVMLATMLFAWRI
jgi:hypothetical protein